MTDNQMLAAFIVTILLVTIWVTVTNRKRNRAELAARLMKSYGQPFVFEQNHEHLVNLHEILKSENVNVNDETWHDLTMDQVFSCLDQSVSAVGEEYFYLTLHRLQKDTEILAKRNELAEELAGEEKSRPYRSVLSGIGKHKKYTVYRFINIMLNAKKRDNLPHILMLLSFILSFISMFIVPSIGIMLCLVIACVNSVTYFSAKSRIAGYDYSIDVIVKWLAAVGRLKEGEGRILNERVGRIKELSSGFAKIKRVSWLFAPQSVVGSIIDTIIDYLKFITHIDLIVFNYMVGFLANKKEELRMLYEETGELELGIIISGIRAYDMPSSVPKRVFEGRYIHAKEMFHPLVKNPVCNDVELDNNSLITGSNASGKSTFLKMVTLNCLLAETINTVFAKDYEASYFDIRTSFDISDDILAGDSFYIAEIKRLKKIIDFSEDNEGTLICIDEILKGTNTTERIAASSEILRYLSKSRSLVLAATHDVELTEILAGEYDNYYFTENPDNEENIFDYRLYRGKNYTGNAIRILSMYGFPEEIIQKSYEAVKKADLDT